MIIKACQKKLLEDMEKKILNTKLRGGLTNINRRVENATEIGQKYGSNSYIFLCA